MNNKNKRNALQNLALITQLGLSVVTPILLGVYIGQFLDRKIGKEGIFSIIFIILGAGAGFMNIFKLAGPGRKRK